MNRQTDNQQRKVSDTDIAWLTGLIDGEGSIGLKVQKYMKGKSVFYVAPYIQVVNTHEATLAVVDRIFTDSSIGHYIDWPRPHRHPNGVREITEYKPLWRILVNGLKRCHSCLNLIMPYLVTKRSDALKVMEFIHSRESSYYKHLPYSDRELEIISEFRRVRRSGKIGSPIITEIAQRLDVGNA